jgi:hypothetical protein
MYYNLLFQCLLNAQHVSSETPLIIRSSKTVIAASGFTYVCGCRPLQLQFLSSWWWAVCRSKHVEHLINIGIINYNAWLHLVGYFCMIYTLMHGSTNIKGTFLSSRIPSTINILFYSINQMANPKVTNFVFCMVWIEYLCPTQYSVRYTAVICLKRLIVGLSPCRPDFNPRPIVRILVDEVALGKVFIRVL